MYLDQIDDKSNLLEHLCLKKLDYDVASYPNLVNKEEQ